MPRAFKARGGQTYYKQSMWDRVTNLADPGVVIGRTAGQANQIRSDNSLSQKELDVFLPKKRKFKQNGG